ncbi:uncharacterized oxidoreductase At4g09670-like [Tripterygium wilfordii]|uniref:uncharacterized oxidoreductase At4g09670-like n=1 Tax=Tripterygium wilfordii TaxID=458696 RepID=UPI0018F81955|nr:uncharacterized oxidoreductase At4g09670-like [Tripterygium wilfordii]
MSSHEMAQAPIQFGIIGCAGIAHKVSRAITLAPNATLVAIANRSVEKAEKFASANNFPLNAKVYGSYEFFLDKITEACEANGVQFMDGMMWIHDPRTSKITKACEIEANFRTSTKIGFTELLPGWVPLLSEHVVTTNLLQEARMVMEFTGLVGNIKTNGARPEKKWAIISRKTQLIFNAVKASIKKGFEPVEIAN